MVIADPTLIFLLITLGLVGVGVETLTPGGLLPALVGIAALVLGVIGLFNVEPTPVGMGLLFLALAFFIAAVALRLYRPFSIAGAVALAASGIFMFDRGTDPTSIPAVVIGAIVIGVFMIFVIERAGFVRSQPVRYGPEDLVGMTGDVRSPLRPEGQVFIDGALWQAELAPPDESLATGERIEVVAMHGLTMVVRPESKTEPGSDPEEGEAV